MKTGLSKKQKTTGIFFTEADDWIEVSTFNIDLKKRLSEFALNYPASAARRRKVQTEE